MDRRRPTSLAPRTTAVFALATLLAAAAPAAAGPTQAPPADAAQRAKELHQKGRKAYKDGDLRAAYDAYLAAWGLQKTYDIAANLAVVEIATSRYRDAADHLVYALANLPVSGEGDTKRPKLQEMLKQAKGEIGTLTIRVSADGAAVSVDGKSAGTSPLAEEIYVDPGEHTVIANLPGGPPAEQKVRIDKGGASLVTLTVRAAGAVEGPKPPPATGPSPITIGGFVVSGLGLAAGTALAIVAKTKSDAANSKYEALSVKGPSACAGAAPPADCKALHDARAGRDTFANAALWTFVGAGLVTAGTLVYTFTAPKASPAPAQTALRALPTFSPEGGGLVVQGSF